MRGRQNITTSQWPPAKGSELKPIYICSAMAGKRWRKAESSHAAILRRTHKKSPKHKKQTTKTPLNVSQGFSEGKIHLKNWAWTPAQGPFGPLQTFPKSDSARGFHRTWGSEPGFGSGAPWPSATNVFYSNCTCEANHFTLQQPHCKCDSNSSQFPIHKCCK